MSSNWKQALDKEISVIAYFDLANMFGWQRRLGWRFRVAELIVQLRQTPPIKEVKAYFGLNGREPNKSLALHRKIQKAGAVLRTKPVKFIRKTVDASMFFKQTTLNQMEPGAATVIESFVASMRETSTEIEEMKCNFDVEMTMEMLDDTEKVSAVMIFSGDSDFLAPLERLKLKGKRVYVVGVRGAVASELFGVADYYVDFGKLYVGERIRPNSENPAGEGGAA